MRLCKGMERHYPPEPPSILSLRSSPSRGTHMASTPGNPQSAPRRGGPSRSGDDEHQTVMQRRAVAAGVIVLLLILIVLLAKGCAASRKERGIKDFIQQTNSIVTQSNQSSRDFF